MGASKPDHESFLEADNCGKYVHIYLSLEDDSKAPNMLSISVSCLWTREPLSWKTGAATLPFKIVESVCIACCWKKVHSDVTVTIHEAKCNLWNMKFVCLMPV